MAVGSSYVREQLAAAAMKAIQVTWGAQQSGVRTAPVPGRGLTGSSHLKGLLQLERPEQGKAVTPPHWKEESAFLFRFRPPHSLEQLQRDGAPGLGLHALAPELQLRVDGAVKQEVLIEAF